MSPADRHVVAGRPATAEEALRAAEYWGAQVYRGLRAGERVDDEAVHLACLLLDWGHHADVVRDLVTRRPADIPEPEMAELAAALLRVSGFDPGFALAPERLAVLEQAVRKVAADFAGSAIAGIDGLHLVRTDDVGPRALLALGDGTLLNMGNGLAPATGDDPVRAAAEVAAEVQDEVAARFRVVWPVCVEHRLGARPAVTARMARWRCAVGGPVGHDMAEVGRLGTSKQALRASVPPRDGPASR
ncbi:hypothetical protein [Actinacidiphila acidipaludis]|uniref:Uncharacterized protein n=1 Tax=Actinacidiphila acidipaludis TaxID=2873382 RepID=A0ABS7PZ60_9ACTN|nr:hypothetical protein [Streptomyces acidipaludis]MBY8876158.1 hypothetical protein [Streptomyces acidipaludis]